MTSNRFLAGLLLAATAAAAGGCASGPSGFDPYESVAAQPRSATWRCDSGVTLAIETQGSQVKVAMADGNTVVLPASPPGQNARFGVPPYALVFDGREALWFVTGKQPLNCRR